MKLKTPQISGFSILALILVLSLLTSCDKVVNYNPSFDSQQKIPFGTYICYEEMSTLFPDTEIERINSNLFDFLEDGPYRYYETLTYFDLTIHYDSIQQIKLREFVDNENIIFFSFRNADIFNDSIQTATIVNDTVFINNDTILSFNNMSYKEIALSKEQKNLNLLNDDGSTQNFGLKGHIMGNYFSKIPESAEVLGNYLYKDQKLPNYIKVPTEYGWYYLHAEPFVFTNIGLLNDDVAKYTANVFSFLPSETILWNNYRIQSRMFQQRSDGGPFAFLNFAWTQQPLRIGALLLILGGLLYVLINSARRQKPVAYVSPYKNDNLNYSESLIQVYRRTSNFKYLCNQKMTYFRNMMFQHYYFTHFEYNDDFAQNLHQKSQVSLNECINLVNYLNNINKKGYCSREQFTKLSALLESFYQNSNLYGKQ